jgi:hypothetical protein
MLMIISSAFFLAYIFFLIGQCVGHSKTKTAIDRQNILTYRKLTNLFLGLFQRVQNTGRTSKQLIKFLTFNFFIMAIIKSGAAGKFNGKFSDAVITEWKGLTVGRSLPSKSSKPPKLSQLMQRAKFGLITSFIGKIGDTFSLGFKNTRGALTAYNAAAKKNILTAITGNYPDYKLDYSKIELSDGNGTGIDKPFEVTHTPVANNRTTLTWAAIESNRSGSLGTDVLRVVFYNERGNFSMVHEHAEERSKLTATVRLPFEEDTDEIYGWAMFVSADGERVSTSVYLGKFLKTV